MQMNIYKISQTINNGYDTFDSVIVAAVDQNEARKMRLCEKFSSSWSDPEYVTVEYIGLGAIQYRKPEIVLASFNAG